MRGNLFLDPAVLVIGPGITNDSIFLSSIQSTRYNVYCFVLFVYCFVLLVF